ncbi:hypothetical protein SUGI_0421200 [Cryptomeria japonica]|nr:hypothetical protein SUGI_0421200 [Cryptomeria japonica]
MLLAIRSVWEMSGQGKKPVNLTNLFSSFVQAVMWRILADTKFSFNGDTHLGGHGEEVKKMASEVAATVGAVNIGDFIPYFDWLDLQGVKRRMKKVHESFDQVISKIIEEHQQRRREFRKESDTKDIIDVLLEMESLDGREITEENIKAIVFDIFVAGVETTSTSLDWAMSAILKNPGVAKKCKRKSIQWLIVNAWAIGRDPSLWEDPLEFKPERFMGKNVDVVRDKDSFDMVPFGAGRRGCPGASMAVVTMNLVLAQLVHWFECSVDGDLDMTEVFGAATPRSVDLLVRPTLRLSTCP